MIAVLTKREIRKAVTWAKHRDQLGLGDWKFLISTSKVATGPEPDDGAAAHVYISPCDKIASIWISKDRHIAQKLDMLATVFHEVLHVMGVDSEMEPLTSAVEERKEYSWNGLGGMMARLYRLEHDE